MAELIFFGHDAHDPAVQRRIKAFEHAGAVVRAFTMRRGPAFKTPWINIDLGETKDAAFAQRMLALMNAAPIVHARRDALRHADLFYARNLDMLALAVWAKRVSGSRAPIVYECLDIHRFMTREDALGGAMRNLERMLLNDVKLVVVSSPAFVREYFDQRHPGRVRAMLIENRLPWGFEYGPRPVEPQAPSGPIRIGWYGNLRCKRSLALLLALADRFPDWIEIVMRGAPARTELGAFEADIAERKNVSFGGRYAWPNDLASIYADVDLVWAGDFHDPDANSKWLLPNRIYEGGYYCTPSVAPADSETGRWIDEKGLGFTLAEPLEETLPAFFETLTRDRILEARGLLAAAPEETFLQPKNELKTVIDAARAEPRP